MCLGFRVIVPLKWIEYGVYGSLVIIFPKPYSIFLRGLYVFKGCSVFFESLGLRFRVLGFGV